MNATAESETERTATEPRPAGDTESYRTKPLIQRSVMSMPMLWKSQL